MSELQKPDRLKELEAKGALMLTEAELVELDNLQADYMAQMANGELPEVDPESGLPMIYQPEQVGNGYQPEPMPQDASEAFFLLRHGRRPTWLERQRIRFRRWRSGR